VTATTLVLVLCLVAGASALPTGARARGPVLRWRVVASTSGDWVLSLAAAPDGTVYAGTWVGKEIHALGPDGALRRTLPAGNGCYALALGRNGILFAAGGGEVRAFDANGARKWTVADGLLLSALALGRDDTVYVSRYTTLLELDPESGVVRRKLEGHGASKLAVGSDGAVYGGGPSGCGVSALAPDGTPKWTARPGCGVSAIRVGNDGVVYVGAHHDYTVFDPTGAVRHVPPPRGAASARVYALEPQSGAIEWSFAARGTIFAIAQATDGTVYAGSFDGNVYAIDPRDGTLRWRLSTGPAAWGSSPVHALAVGSDGTIYAGAGDGVEAIDPPHEARTPHPTP
jgi:outer membrane protein assembly factor BamB